MPVCEHLIDCSCGQPLDRVAVSSTPCCPRCGRIVNGSAGDRVVLARDGLTGSLTPAVHAA